MLFLVPQDKKTLFFYIFIILLGILLEYYQITSTEKVIAVGMLIAIIVLTFKYFISKKH